MPAFMPVVHGICEQLQSIRVYNSTDIAMQVALSAQLARHRMHLVFNPARVSVELCARALDKAAAVAHEPEPNQLLPSQGVASAQRGSDRMAA